MDHRDEKDFRLLRAMARIAGFYVLSSDKFYIQHPNISITKPMFGDTVEEAWHSFFEDWRPYKVLDHLAQVELSLDYGQQTEYAHRISQRITAGNGLTLDQTHYHLLVCPVIIRIKAMCEVLENGAGWGTVDLDGPKTWEADVSQEALPVWGAPMGPEVSEINSD